MKSLSIRQKLTIATALVVLVLLSIFSLINYSQAKQRLVADVNTSIAVTGDNLSGYVSEWVAGKLAILSAASKHSSDRANHTRILTQGKEAGDFLYMYFGTKDGEMIMIPKEDLPADYDPRTRPWYQQAVSAGKAIITPPYVDASSGSLVISFAMPTAIGVAAADVGMNSVNDEVLNIQLGETGSAMLVDASGKVLIHKNEDYLEQSLNSLLDEGRVSTTVSEVTMDGEVVLAQAFPVPGTDWQIVITIERDDALSELSTLAMSSLVLTVVILAVVALSVGLLINFLLKPLRALALTMADIADGEADLTQRLAVRGNDELGSVSRHFNNFIESIHRMVIEVIDSADQMDVLSKQSNQAAGENNHSVQNQQQEITQVAAAIHEMSSTSATVADNAAVTAEAAQKAANETKISEKNASENRSRMQELTVQIDDTTQVINQLNEHAQKINTILATIQGIAEQTNLLALNAAIEAARAGEQGRGFAVVADEVRALSQRTHEATGEIQSMIEALGAQTGSAVTQMAKSKSLVEDTMTTAQAVSDSQASIEAAIAEINTQALSIAEASREQNTATEEISRISQAIQDESHRLAENVASSYELSEQMDELGRRIQGNLSRFRT